MKKKIDLLEFEKEISNIPIGDKVQDKGTASHIRSQISSYSPEAAAVAAIDNNDINLFQFIFENTKIELTDIRDFLHNSNHDILHLAARIGNVAAIKFILNNTNIDPTDTTNDGMNVCIADKHGNSDSSLANTIKAIEDLLDDEESKVDFSKQVLDEELFLKMFVHYVCRPQLAQKTIGELKEIYIPKFKKANLPGTLVKAVPNSLDEWAKNILVQESYLMSQDCTLHIEDCPLENIYYELPLLIKRFNPDNEIEIYGLKQWFKNFPNLNKQLDNFIESVKEAKLEQLVAKLKTNLIEQVYNDVAGDYLNKLAKLPDDEILMKCIVNEHFAAALKSINPLFLNTETQDKFSDIIEEYEVEKDKLEINFKDFIITEELGPNDDATDPEDKTPMGDYEPGSCFIL